MRTSPQTRPCCDAAAIPRWSFPTTRPPTPASPSPGWTGPSRYGRRGPARTVPAPMGASRSPARRTSVRTERPRSSSSIICGSSPDRSRPARPACRCRLRPGRFPTGRRRRRSQHTHRATGSTRSRVKLFRRHRVQRQSESQVHPRQCGRGKGRRDGLGTIRQWSRACQPGTAPPHRVRASRAGAVTAPGRRFQPPSGNREDHYA